jgi:hypothetical protein
VQEKIVAALPQPDAAAGGTGTTVTAAPADERVVSYEQVVEDGARLRNDVPSLLPTFPQSLTTSSATN